MFKVGEKVVCVKEPETTKYLRYGDVYTIKSVTYNRNMKGALLIFDEIPNTTFSGNRFKSNIEFRKEKIIKLKEKINGKQT